MNEKPWRAILARLNHREVWGPGGIAPLDGFRRSGSGWVARCPKHRPDVHPSFHMKDGKTHGFCFACRARVSWIDHLAALSGKADKREAFWAALERLAAHAGVPVPPRASASSASPRPDAFEAAARWLKARLFDNTPVAARCREYLESRHVAMDVLELLPAGCLPHPNDVVPVLRTAGCALDDIRATGLTERYLARTPLIFIYSDGERVTGFKGRAPDRKDKRILNAKGFGGEREQRSPYCLDLARPAIQATRQVFMVEGEHDCLGWHGFALRRKQVINWVAIGGTSKPSPHTYRRLREFGADTALLGFDDDDAGRLSTAAAIGLAWEAGMEPVVVGMPKGCKDPDDVYTRFEPDAGLAALGANLSAAPTWLAGYWRATFPTDGPDSMAKVLGEARRLAASAPPIALEALAAALASTWGLDVAVVRADLQRAAEEARRQRLLGQFEAWRKETATLQPQDLPDALSRGQAVLDALRGAP